MQSLGLEEKHWQKWNLYLSSPKNLRNNQSLTNADYRIKSNLQIKTKINKKQCKSNIVHENRKTWAKQVPGELTRGMVKESVRERDSRVEAVLNGEHEIERNRKTRKHVLEDQSLVLQFLPLRHCEWGPPITTETHHSSSSATDVHVFHCCLLALLLVLLITRHSCWVSKSNIVRAETWDHTRIELCRKEPFGFGFALLVMLQLINT